MRRLLWLLMLACGLWLAAGCQVTGNEAVDVSVGETGACLVTGVGGVECWGQFLDSYDGEVIVDYSATPQPLASLASDVTDIALGNSHACVIARGKVQCWGENSNGELGNGASVNSAVPVAVIGLPSDSAAVQLSSYRAHTCARLANGAVWCWGNGAAGNLGNGDNDAFARTPVMAVGFDGSPGNRATGIAAGSSFTCASRPNGTVECWGSDFYGQLGNGVGQADSNVPVLVPGLDQVINVGAGESHVCAGTSSGDLYCWGDNYYEAVASAGGIAMGPIESPVLSASFSSTPTDFGAGDSRTCIVVADGTAECVGHRNLGDGTSADSDVGQMVAGTDTSPVSKVDSHFGSSCVVGIDGDVRCWGSGASGQLGNGTRTDSLLPVTVSRPG